VTAIGAEQARALGAPTRQAIIAYLQSSAGPVGVAELTQHLGLNHNAVRKHLAKLVAAGIAREHTEPRTRRGRPRLVYTLDPDATGDDASHYQRLAVLLAETLATGDDPADVGRRAGASRAPAMDDPLAALVDGLARDGFSPEVDIDHAAIALRRCPFAEAADANPAAVCRLHLGLAQGLADTIGGIQVDRLFPADPHSGDCRLTIRTPPRQPASPDTRATPCNHQPPLP
jgi:predicted ArsR family transcriptional regulator